MIEHPIIRGETEEVWHPHPPIRWRFWRRPTVVMSDHRAALQALAAILERGQHAP